MNLAKKRMFKRGSVIGSAAAVLLMMLPVTVKAEEVLFEIPENVSLLQEGDLVDEELNEAISLPDERVTTLPIEEVLPEDATTRSEAEIAYQALLGELQLGIYEANQCVDKEYPPGELYGLSHTSLSSQVYIRSFSSPARMLYRHKLTQIRAEYPGNKQTEKQAVELAEQLLNEHYHYVAARFENVEVAQLTYDTVNGEQANELIEDAVWGYYETIDGRIEGYKSDESMILAVIEMSDEEFNTWLQEEKTIYKEEAKRMYEGLDKQLPAHTEGVVGGMDNINYYEQLHTQRLEDWVDSLRSQTDTPVIETEKYEEIPYQTEYVDDPDLYEGDTFIEQEGAKGYRMNGIVIQPEVNEIIRIGTKAWEEEIPYETEYVETDDLEKGIEKVIQAGVPGKRIKGEVETEPVNEIIQVGTAELQPTPTQPTPTQPTPSQPTPSQPTPSHQTPQPSTGNSGVYYHQGYRGPGNKNYDSNLDGRSCSDLKSVGIFNIQKGDYGYTGSRDRDNDGVACDYDGYYSGHIYAGGGGTSAANTPAGTTNAPVQNGQPSQQNLVASGDIVLTGYALITILAGMGWTAGNYRKK